MRWAAQNLHVVRFGSVADSRTLSPEPIIKPPPAYPPTHPPIPPNIHLINLLRPHKALGIAQVHTAAQKQVKQIRINMGLGDRA